MREFDLVIRNGRVFTNGALQALDIGIDEGRIAKLGTNLSGRESLDAQQGWVLPGMIDTHVHFREPGRTDKEDFASGSRAALAGGVTTVLEIQNNEPLMTSASILREKHARITGRTHVHYGLYANLGVENLASLSEIATEAVAFKVFMTQSVGPLTVTGLADLWRAFRAVAKTGKVLAVHAESDPICKAAREGLPDHVTSHVLARPPLAESVAVAEALELARESGVRLHLAHLSTARSVELVAEARNRGQRLSAATCPHYLVFTAEDVARGGNVFKVNPAIKYQNDLDGLIEGVRSGVVDHIHSDHAPHTPHEKSQNFFAAPSGIAGIQHQLLTVLELAHRGRLSLSDVVRATAEAPAKAFDLEARGVIKVGAHADLTLVAENEPFLVQKKDLLSKSQDSPWVGHAFPHRIAATVISGRVAYAQGEFSAAEPAGRRIA